MSDFHRTPRTKFFLGADFNSMAQKFQATNQNMSSILSPGLSTQGSNNDTTSLGYGPGLLVTKFLPEGSVSQIIVTHPNSSIYEHLYTLTNGNKYTERTHSWEIPFDNIASKMYVYNNDPSRPPVTFNDFKKSDGQFNNGGIYTVTFGNIKTSFHLNVDHDQLGNIRLTFTSQSKPVTMGITQPGYVKTGLPPLLHNNFKFSAVSHQTNLRKDLNNGEIKSITVRLDTPTIGMFQNYYVKVDGSKGGPENTSEWDIPFDGAISERIKNKLPITRSNFFSNNNYTYTAPSGHSYVYRCLISNTGNSIIFNLISSTKMSATRKFGAIRDFSVPVNHEIATDNANDNNVISPFIGSMAHIM